MFTRDFLAGVRRKALRRKVWYSALDRVERGILSLTSRIVDRVESRVLGVMLVKIIAKLKEALKSPFARKMETYGIMKARQLSRVAVEWGYTTAQRWANETGYVKHLTNNELNTPGHSDW